MLYIILDAYVFACPEAEASINKFETYIKRLIEVRDFEYSECVNLLKDDNLFEVLSVTGYFPIYEKLSELCYKNNIDYIQPSDLNKLILGLFQRTKSLETLVGINDLLIEEFISVPNIHHLSLPKEFIESFEKVAVVSSIAQNLKLKDLSLAFIVHNNTQNYDITAKVPLVDPPNDKIPTKIAGAIKCCKSIAEPILQCDISCFFNDIITPNSFFYALAVKHYKLEGNIDFKNLLADLEVKITILETLIEDMTTLCFHTSTRIGQLMSVINKVLQGEGQSQSHALRTGRGGNNPQIEKNGYKAWRMDIDYEFHLHFWEKEDSYVFSNIVHHNNFKISNPPLE